MNLYWYKTGANAHWDTLTGNWWEDAVHTVQASALPTTGNFVYLRGATAPDTAPSTPVALSGFDTQGLTDTGLSGGVTSNVSIQSGGTLTMGDPAAPGNSHDWGGATAASGTFAFNDSSLNSGTVGDHATFNDNSSNLGLVGDYATFNDTTTNCQTVTDYATFNGTAINLVSAGDYTTFNVNSMNMCIVGDYATFNNDACNAGGTVGDYTTFNDASFSDGPGNTVGDYYVITSTEFKNYSPGHIGRTALLPAAGDVRSGVTFGQEQTGTLAPGGTSVI